MAEWHDIVWQSLLQELQHMKRQRSGLKTYSIKNMDGFIQLEVEGHSYLFDKGGYAGNTSAEIAHNMAEDIIENYLV